MSLPEEEGAIEGIYAGLSQGEVQEITSGYKGKKFEETFSNSEWLTVVGSNEDVYVIEEGDSLWDICNRLLDNPYYWPKLWQLNQYITNPHFIYPGSELHFFPGSDVQPPSMEVVKKSEKEEAVAEEEGFQEEDKAREEGEAEAEETAEEEGVVGDEELRRTKYKGVESLEQKGFKVNYHMTGLISEEKLPRVGRIVDSKTVRNFLQVFDIVQLEMTVGVSQGDRFTVFREDDDEVEDPINGDDLGYKNKFIGEILVIKAGEGYIEGKILSALLPIERGDLLTTESMFFSNIKSQLSDKPMAGHIVCPEDRFFKYIGAYQAAYTNLGAEDGVIAGNLFRIVRKEILNSNAEIDEDEITEEIIGLLMILNVQRSTSLGLILSSKRPLVEGDKLVMLRPEMVAESKEAQEQFGPQDDEHEEYEEILDEEEEELEEELEDFEEIEEEKGIKSEDELEKEEAQAEAQEEEGLEESAEEVVEGFDDVGSELNEKPGQEAQFGQNEEALENFEDFDEEPVQEEVEEEEEQEQNDEEEEEGNDSEGQAEDDFANMDEEISKEIEDSIKEKLEEEEE